MPSLPRQLLRPLLGILRRLRHSGRRPSVRYRLSASPLPRPVGIDVLVAATTVDPSEAASWCGRQTLRELQVVAHDSSGAEAWRVDRDGPLQTVDDAAAFFAVPGGLPLWVPSRLETALYVLLSEEIDALEMSAEEPRNEKSAHHARSMDDAAAFAAVTDPPSPRAIFRRDSFAHHSRTGAVSLAEGHKGPRRLKWLTAGAPARYFQLPGNPSPVLEIGLRDLGRLREADLGLRRSKKPTILVTVPFLARGGAEHTLLETLRHLRDRYDYTLVTLAPHRAELGDRHGDFIAEVSPHLLPLGDLVHPDAMVAILLSLLTRTDAQVLYNANGTTLFYDFAPLLRAARPGLRIIDHLYDHRIGYIDRYGPELLGAVDACVAENQRIHDVLTAERGWPAARVPVIWPCGRREDAFPPPDERPSRRRRLRTELSLAEDDIVVLTAARMHPQKRPLDLVALADRLRDLSRLCFLVVGGGELEAEMDAAIAAAPRARIRRLPFRDDIPELLVACDFGCLVSAYEGLPVFLLECLQAGRPFVGTDVGDVATMLERTRAGIVSGAPGDLAALESALRRMADDGERRALSARAATAGAELGVAACAERYAAIFAGRAAE